MDVVCFGEEIVTQRTRWVMENDMADLTVYLLRHGESLANAGHVFASRKVDPPLSDIGIQQATLQAESLRAVKFSCMYASPLLRARQTAEIVSQKCGLELTLSDALQEVDVGILDGESQDDPHKWATYEEILGKWEHDLGSAGFPGGETLNDIEYRFRGFLDGVESKEDKRILVVGHCLLFMAVIWLFCENHGPTLENGHMGRGHLSIISKTGDRFRVLKFNISPDTSGGHILLI